MRLLISELLKKFNWALFRPSFGWIITLLIVRIMVYGATERELVEPTCVWEFTVAAMLAITNRIVQQTLYNYDTAKRQLDPVYGGNETLTKIQLTNLCQGAGYASLWGSIYWVALGNWMMLSSENLITFGIIHLELVGIVLSVTIGVFGVVENDRIQIAVYGNRVVGPNIRFRIYPWLKSRVLVSRQFAAVEGFSVDLQSAIGQPPWRAAFEVDGVVIELDLRSIHQTKKIDMTLGRFHRLAKKSIGETLQKVAEQHPSPLHLVAHDWSGQTYQGCAGPINFLWRPVHRHLLRMTCCHR